MRRRVARANRALDARPGDFTDAGCSRGDCGALRRAVAILHRRSRTANAWTNEPHPQGEARVCHRRSFGRFAPLENIGLMSLMKSTEASYKQEETPRYHGRDIPSCRASATP